MTEVASTDLTAFGMYQRPRSRFSPTDRPSLLYGQTTGSPESQQRNGSQIIRICMEIYLNLRSIKRLKCTKTAIKVYIRHKKLCLCCFLTISCPIDRMR